MSHASAAQGGTAVHAEGLGKSFSVTRKAAGVKASLRGLFTRQIEQVVALQPATFTIQQGERVGILGPNGAGKTTLMKLLTGILTPSAGRALVLGHEPSKRERAFLTRIALVLGGKGQLWWDLPANESFLLAAAMYDLPDATFRSNLARLTEQLAVTDLLDVPVRKLSLGQRMRLELVLCLLHDPAVLFLDEPTLGLDVVSQHQVREFLKARNREAGTTILLTSHYMEDITALCERVIVIDHGQVWLDSSYQELVRTVAATKDVELTLEEDVPDERLRQYGTLVQHEGLSATFTVPRAQAAAQTARMLQELPVADLNVREPEASTIVRELFTKRDAGARD